MTRRRGAARAVVAVTMLVALGACTKQLDVAKPERAIGREVERTYGVTVRAVSCPDDVPAKKGTTFQCVVTLDDDRLQADVTQTDSQGGLTFRLAQAILTRRSVAKAINKEYNATFVDCGRRAYWVSKPGRSFRCTARDETGESGRIVVTIRDTRGNIDLDFAQ